MELKGRFTETEQFLWIRQTQFQQENDQLRVMMERIQENLRDLQKGEKEEQELAIPAKTESFFSCVQRSQSQPELTFEASETGGSLQPFIVMGITIGKEREVLPQDQRDLTVDSVKSFLVHTNQIKDSDSDGSIEIEKHDLPLARVRGFAPPHFDGGRNESTMKFKTPKNYNPTL